MTFGDNAKIVLKILTDFLDLEKHIVIRPDSANKNKIYGPDSFVYTVTLKMLSEEILQKADFNPDNLFDVIYEDYNSNRGIERYITYTKILKHEESQGFENLKELIEILRKKIEFAHISEIKKN